MKNNKTTTYELLNQIPCTRRILLSGTPLQNDLNEFYSMVNFTNKNVIGKYKIFTKYYESPILIGREPYALDSEINQGQKMSGWVLIPMPCVLPWLLVANASVRIHALAKDASNPNADGDGVLFSAKGFSFL